MKILLIGASGTLGSAVKERLEKKAEVITAGRHSGDVTVDITSVDSIKKMYEQVGKVDAIVSATEAPLFLL